MSTMQADELDIPATLGDAVAEHRSGDLAAAERLYRRILAAVPGQADANYNLGVLAMQTGHAANALAHFQAALQADPSQGRFWLGCIGTLVQLGQRQAAAEMLAKARQCGLDPAAADRVAAQLNGTQSSATPEGASGRRNRKDRPRIQRKSQGKTSLPATPRRPRPEETNAVLLLLKEARYAEAEASARSLTVLYPRDGFGWKILGIVLDHRGQLDAALVAKRAAAELLPTDADAHLNLGNALRRAGKPAEAEASYRRAIHIQPHLASAHNRLAITLQSQGRAGEAERSYRQAVALKPDFAEAHSNLGIMLWNREDAEGAEACYRRAIEIDPGFPEFHSNLASLLVRLGRVAEAEAACRRAITLKPDFAEGWNNLGDTLQAAGRNAEAADAYRRALECKPDFPWAFSNLLFCLSHEASVAPDTLFANHLEFGGRFEAPLRPHWPRHRNVPDPGRVLRVGVASADLRDHAVAYFAGPVLRLLARDPSLSLHAYYNNRMEDPVTGRLRGYFQRWTQVSEMTDAELAARIESDSIDILIDLSGHTNGGRLLALARKPAPIQCGWIGYLGTSGLQAIDYYLADPHFLPREEFQTQFTEKLVHLPAVAPFQSIEDVPAVGPLPALANGRMTFGSFSRLTKLSPEVVALWCELLRAVPGSRLVLGAMPKDGASAMLAEWFSAQGIPPDRLDFIHARFIHDYLALHREIDICLDPFPFTGATTTGHALWMGVPTLTLSGKTAPGRLGPALLRHAGLDDFVAASRADFLAKGLRWADDPPGLARIRAGLRLRLQESLLGQPEVIASALSRALRTMWRGWCTGSPPQGF